MLSTESLQAPQFPLCEPYLPFTLIVWKTAKRANLYVKRISTSLKRVRKLAEPDIALSGARLSSRSKWTEQSKQPAMKS